jgi:hypothetical protein
MIPAELNPKPVTPPEGNCPVCGHRFEIGYSSGERTELKPGCLSLCAHCGNVLKYDENLQRRAMTPEEMEELRSTKPAVWKFLMDCQLTVISGQTFKPKKQNPRCYKCGREITEKDVCMFSKAPDHPVKKNAPNCSYGLIAGAFVFCFCKQCAVRVPRFNGIWQVNA